MRSAWRCHVAHFVQPRHSLSSDFEEQEITLDTAATAFLRSVPDTTVERLKKEKAFFRPDKHNSLYIVLSGIFIANAIIAELVGVKIFTLGNK